jgi:hypothetical protein
VTVLALDFALLFSGASSPRVIGRHLLPNAAAPLIVAAAILVGRVIVMESVLSFLGLGVQPPDPSLGNLLYGAQASLATEPWLAVFPGLFIFWIVLAVNETVFRSRAPRAHIRLNHFDSAASSFDFTIGCSPSGENTTLTRSDLLPSTRAGLALAFGVLVLSAIRLFGEQGARLGAFVFPAFGPLWLGGVLLAAAIAVPRARETIPVTRTILLATALGALAWPVAAFREVSVRSDGWLGVRSSDRGLGQVARIDLAEAKRRMPLLRLTGRSLDVRLEISGVVPGPRGRRLRFRTGE